MNLQILWFLIVAFFWSGYFLLEGFDFGVGMLLPFLPRDERERSVMLQTIGPVWDGNEVWLVIAGGTTFANLGPTSADLAKNVRTTARAILKLERPYNPGLTMHDIPVDAVTTSGSGIDPDISPANAALQSRRVAAVRHLPLATVEKLIDENTDGRSLGFFGEPGVNVLKLNLALGRIGGR